MALHRVHTLVCLMTLVWSSSIGVADDALHTQIDKLIEEASFGALAPIATDGEFLRRAYLDLTGSIPPANVARQFLDDQTPNKRTEVIDRLLASPQHIRHLTNVVDVMLMERRAEKHVKNDEWRQYLYDSIAANKPWNQLVKEIVAADGTDEKIRNATAFYFARNGEPNLLTRDVGRMFFGMDLQCAQCHDHPLIDSYYQSDYYGIYAFLSRGFIYTAKDKKVFYAEKAEGDVSFTSVFTEEQDKTFPRLPGAFEIDEPFFLKGDEYSVAPAKDVRPIPKYSRRTRLSELIDSGTNRQFNRNIANRLWAMMMGRGLVEPVDLHHADNPPSHPELLELLADRFAAMNYDIKAFIRELALTNTYQRSLSLPQDLSGFVATLEPRVQQLHAADATATEALKLANQAVAKIDEKIASMDADADAVYDELTKVNAAIGEAQKKSDEATKALTDAKNQLAAKQSIATPLIGAATSANEAAKLLPNEADVVAIANQLQARADKSKAEVTAAEKVVQDKTAPANSASDALAAAKATTKEVSERFAEARQKLRGIESERIPAASSLLVADTQKLHTKQDVKTVEFILEFAKLSQSQNNLQQSLLNHDAKLAEARKSMQTADSALATVKQMNTTAIQNLERAKSAHQTAITQHEVLQQASMLIDQAKVAVSAVSLKLPDDSDVKTTLVSLEQRNKELATKLVESQRMVTAKQQDVLDATQQVTKAKAETDIKTTKLAQHRDLLAKLTKERDSLNADLAEHRTELNQAAEEFALQSEERFFVSGLRHLSPEQMSWSMMEATGYLDGQRRAGTADADKSLPIDPKNPNDATRLTERAKHVETYVFNKMKGNLATFVRLFGHGAGQPQADFFATVDQALFFSNGGSVLSWLNPSGNNLTARLNKLDDPSAIAEEMYISVLTRRPTEQEVYDVVDYLKPRESDKVNALKEMTWALVTSTEFRFSH